MKKTLAILKREYIQAVRKKSFIIATILIPILGAGMMFLPTMMMKKSLTRKHIAIIDATGRLESMTVPEPAEAQQQADTTEAQAQKQIEGEFGFEYVDATGSTDLRQAAQPLIDRFHAEGDEKIDGVLTIPSDAIANPDATLVYYSRSATDIQARSRLGRDVNREVQRARLEDSGVPQDQMEDILDRLDLEAIQITKTGEEAKGGELDFLVAFIFAGLLLVPTLLWGTEIMRGVVQEKTDRVVEILVSSMSPIQLLSGKIFGLAAVGLTQLGVWIGLAAIAGAYGGAMLIISDDINLTQFLRPVVFAWFFVFYILAYLLYVCVYAVAGVISNNEKEAQQFLAPVMLFLMIPWFLMMPIIMNPDSTLSLFLSLFPIFAPITMFVRLLVSDPPMWQILTAIALSALTIWGMFWMTAKIFRVGILSYGKRPTIPELWRWLKVA